MWNFWRNKVKWASSWDMAFFVLCRFKLQTRMHSHPVGLDVWFLVGHFVYFHTSCANSEGSGETAWMHRLTWVFAGRLCDMYHNLMSWLKCNFGAYCFLYWSFLSRFQFTWDLHDAENQKNSKSFDFYQRWVLMQFLTSHFLQNYHEVCRIV